MATYSNLGIDATPESAMPSSKYAYGSQNDFQDAMNRANKANEFRYQQGVSLWDKVAGIYQIGGAYEKAALDSYESGKRQSLASAGQSLIGSGMYNTTTTAGLGSRYEKEVGTPTRLGIAANEAQGLASAYQGAAGWIGSKTEAAPDASMYANLQKSVGTGSVSRNSRISSGPAVPWGTTSKYASTPARQGTYYEGPEANSGANFTMAGWNDPWSFEQPANNNTATVGNTNNNNMYDELYDMGVLDW